MTYEPDSSQYAEAMHRVAAAIHRVAAGTQGAVGAAARLGGAMHRFTEALAAADAAEIAEHPDLAELNVQLNNYYG
ncbi:hypothetical protein [Streptomyces luteireticuli]|uniref:PE domain-containing protein n=1 Tax=Streptomyces luteireticuli TaxID=173858 RepID=A0ABN0YZF7_9ACTN